MCRRTANGSSSCGLRRAANLVPARGGPTPATGQERLVADPRALGADEENLPPEERARRERVRETAAGIVTYATDAAASLAVFALSRQVYTVPLRGTPAHRGGAQAGG